MIRRSEVRRGRIDTTLYPGSFPAAVRGPMAPPASAARGHPGEAGSLLSAALLWRLGGGEGPTPARTYFSIQVGVRDFSHKTRAGTLEAIEEKFGDYLRRDFAPSAVPDLDWLPFATLPIEAGRSRLNFRFVSRLTLDMDSGPPRIDP